MLTMSVVACRVKILLIAHALHTGVLVCSLKNIWNTICTYICRERETENPLVWGSLRLAIKYYWGEPERAPQNLVMYRLPHGKKIMGLPQI